MKKLFLSLFGLLVSSAWAGSPTIFQGNNVLLLKPNIVLRGAESILTGSTDPSSVAPASALRGSLYLRSTGQVWVKITTDGSDTNWAQLGAGSSGTVTSVDVSVPSYMTSTGGPVTDSGTVALAFRSQPPNQIFAGPAVAPSGIPSFRPLVAADIPAIDQSKITQFSSSIAPNQIFAGPGALPSGIPSFRPLVAADIPSIDVSKTLQFNQNIAPNQIWAGPGAAPSGLPSFRPLVSADIPSNAANTSGNAATASAFDHTPTACGANTAAISQSTTGAFSCSSVPTIQGFTSANIAGDTFTGATNITGSADVIQHKVKGNSTQNSDIMQILKSDNTVFVEFTKTGEMICNNNNGTVPCFQFPVSGGTIAGWRMTTVSGLVGSYNGTDIFSFAATSAKFNVPLSWNVGTQGLPGLNVNGETTSGLYWASAGKLCFSNQNSTGWCIDANVSTNNRGHVDKVRVVTAAGAVTVAATDYIVVVNKTSGAATTVNLPASPTTGQTFVIKDGKGDAVANNLTVTPAAGTIDGASTSVINLNYGSNMYVYNGTEWNEISSF